MKKYKRIGQIFLLALGLLGAGLLLSNRVSAAGSLTATQLDSATYTVVKDSSSDFHINMVVAGNSYGFYDSNLLSGPLNFKAKSGPFCDGTLYGNNGSSDQKKGITITDQSNSKIDVLINYVNPSGACLTYAKTGLTLATAATTGSGNKGDACTGGSDCVNGVCSTDGGTCITSSSQSTCEQNSGGWALSWLACPVLNAASSLTQALLDLFEGQLSFSVGQLGNGAAKIHQSWALIRDIATALVVVALLIMVFSQAVSFGPFDAYTIRKMLPRLVAAVILIQISWVASIWVIDFVNSIAKGIADLMFYPFGGSANMDLFSLLGNAGLGGTELGVLNWAAIGVVTALAVAFLFSMLGVAFVAIIALLFALFTLIFRKVLIIALLIFAPLALLAWVLPGTERYWKLWRENFIKVLFMFPIIVAIISAGRVFAYVVGSQNNQSNLLSLVFILVGFFGPLFILPRTFKWGGTAMNLAGNGIMKASSRVSERPKKFMDARQEGYSAERRLQSQERYAKGQGVSLNRNPRKLFGVASLVRRPIDKVRAGEADPTLWGRRSQRSKDSYVQAGEETYQKDIEAARSRVLRKGQEIRAKGGNWDRYFQMVGEGATSYYDDKILNDDGTTGREIQIGKTSEAEQDAGRKQTAILGSQTNWRYLESLHRRMEAKDDNGNFVMSEAERVRTRKFFDDNVSTIMPKMPHFYQGYGAAADATGSTLAGQHGVEVESILSKFSKDVRDANVIINDPSADEEKRTTALGARAAAQKSLVTYLQNIQAAANNPNITLDNGALRAVKGFLDSEGGSAFRQDINNARVDGRSDRQVPTIEAYDSLSLTPDARAEIDGIRSSLAPRIDGRTGTLSSVGEQQPAPPRTQSSGDFPPTLNTSSGTNTATFGPQDGELDIKQDDEKNQ